MKKLIFILMVGSLFGSYFVKIGQSSNSSRVQNIEIMGDEYSDYTGQNIKEIFAELGWKNNNFMSPVRYRLYYMAYSGYDQYGLGGSYTITGYGLGLENKIDNNKSHYYSIDWLLNYEFYDYKDFSMGEWSILDDVYTYPKTYFGFAIGIGTYINENFTIEINYKKHNSVHFSEFPYDSLFWWSFDYNRSGLSASISLEI